MANSLYGNPIYLDSTTGATKAGMVIIQAIIWVSSEGAGLDIAIDDDFLLSDGNGNKIAGKRAKTAGDDLHISFPNGFQANGITLTTMDGGVCYLYLK